MRCVWGSSDVSARKEIVSRFVQYSLVVSWDRASATASLREDVLVLVKDSVAQWHLVGMDPLFDSEFRLGVSLIWRSLGS